MFESLISHIFTLLLGIGISALFVIFVLKGAFIGKFLPTTIFLPGYILAVNASTYHTIGIITLTSIAYVIGQLLIYIELRKHGVDILRKIPHVTLPDHRLETVNEYFTAYGGTTLFITNLIPGLRGLPLIPAAAAHYPSERIIAFLLPSTFIYHGIIVIVIINSFDYLT